MGGIKHNTRTEAGGDTGSPPTFLTADMGKAFPSPDGAHAKLMHVRYF